MYASGGGVPRDYVEACKWWILAGADSSSGDDAYTASSEKLQESASQMTADQMARARRQADEWLAAHRPVK
jgi:TPR repeat protein